MQTSAHDAQHFKTVLQALFVAFLWSTSWVLIKTGLEDMPPLAFAGVRYFLAFLVLLAVYLPRRRQQDVQPLPRRMWGRVALYGLVMFTVAQGAMFVALNRLPAVTLNLLLNFNAPIVAVLGVIWLSERPTRLQWAGIVMAVVGVLVYFYPAAIPAAQTYGVLAAAVCLTANVVAVILARDVNSARRYPPLQVTVISMGTGSAVLLLAGLMVEGIPTISLRNWAFILWLAVVNTAFAFTMWNHTLRTLTAAESSICTGTMLIWIPILAVVFLGEHVTLQQVMGLVAVGVGTLVVQLRRANAGG